MRHFKHAIGPVVERLALLLMGVDDPALKILVWPPRLACLVGGDRFSKELVAMFGQPFEVDVDHLDRPEAPGAGVVLDPIVGIGRADEQALARLAPLLSAVLWRVDFLAPG